MAFMKFYQGSEAKAGSYLDGIYLATDTHKLFYKGISYGIGNLENYALKADLNKYLPLTGGTLTGALYVKGNATTYPNFGLSGSGMAYYEKEGFARLFSIGYNSEGEVKYGVLGLSKDTTPLSDGNDLRITPDGVTIKSKTSSDILHAAGGTISINELKSQLGIPSLQSAVGNNNYTGANYISKETNLTEAVLQLDEEIKATNDNLALEHTNAEATYAKKTELSNYLTKTSASNTYQPKGSYLTNVSIATISDLNSSWDALLKAAPSVYVTRHPTIGEVTGKQSLTLISKGDSTVNNYNGTSSFTLKVPGYYNFPFSQNEDYYKLFTIRLTRPWINHRICFDITGRSGGVDHVYLSFDNAPVISAYRVITFGYIGVGVYGPNLSIRKVSGTSTESVFEIYLTPIQDYDECTVFNFVGNYSGFKIEIGNTVDSLPSGTTTCVELNVFRGIAKATTTSIGGIKVGNGLEITSDGTLNCTIQPGSGTVSWGNITGKPSTFTPSPHTHTKSQISDFPTTWAWGNISGKPSFATVAISGSYNDLSNKPSIPSLSGYATQSWVNSQGFLKSSDLQILEVRSGSSLAYVELKSEEHSIKFRKDSYSITYDSETVFDFRTNFNQITNTVYTSLYPSLTYSRSSGISSNPFLSSKLTRRTCVPLNTILGNINYKIIAEPETISGLYLLSFSLYSGSQPTSACEIYSCLFTDITGEDLCRLEKAYPGIMNAMGTGNRFSLNGRNCKSLGKGYFMLDE